VAVCSYVIETLLYSSLFSYCGCFQSAVKQLKSLTLRAEHVSSDSFSAFGPLDSEMFHVFSCWRDFCSLLRFPSTTDSLFAVTVTPNSVNSAFPWLLFGMVFSAITMSFQ